MGSRDAVRNLLHYELREECNSSCRGERCQVSSRERPSCLLLSPENLLRAASLLCPKGREGALWERGRGQMEGHERAGVPTCTDVQMPRFKRKLNVITWLIKY